MNDIDSKYIYDYYKIVGKKAIIANSFTSLFRILFSSSNTVLVSDNRLLRILARLRNLECTRMSGLAEKALQYFALSDAISLLRQKGVPVYFFNRIGKRKEGYKYTEKEIKRMKLGLSFPVMYQDIDKYCNELQDVFGELYSREYVEEIGRIPQVIRVGSTYQHENYHSRYINVENGKRVTTGQQQAYSRTIHVYGRCGVFGYAVEDKDTLPSQLYEELVTHGIDDIRIINHGLWGGNDEYIDHNFLQEVIGMKKGDIVLFYRKHFEEKHLDQLLRRGMRYYDISEEWHARKTDKVTFFDRPGHMNADGYKLVARIIVENLLPTNFNCDDTIIEGSTITADHLKHYYKSQDNSDLEDEIRGFISEILKNYPQDENARNGAIVMNCNPFTYGHRYLIETAARQVDRLYVFVVEEDKSYFRFSDRFEMVKQGTKDIGNVVVVPSGKFIISAYTFPEYFMKDYVKEKNFDVSMDVETFCRFIAPPLNIKIRFAGEEPFDPVTKNYNENMKRILPEHGMEFIEVPRYAIDNERVINATRVRELLANQEYKELQEYIPQTTYKILIEKYK